jgi:hypothetical protein
VTTTLTVIVMFVLAIMCVRLYDRAKQELRRSGRLGQRLQQTNRSPW